MTRSVWLSLLGPISSPHIPNGDLVYDFDESTKPKTAVLLTRNFLFTVIKLIGQFYSDFFCLTTMARRFLERRPTRQRLGAIVIIWWQNVPAI